MIIGSRTQFHVERPWCQRLCLNSVLNVKALVGAFNQEKALVGAFSVIVKTDCETDGSFYSTSQDQDQPEPEQAISPHLQTVTAANFSIHYRDSQEQDLKMTSSWR